MKTIILFIIFYSVISLAQSENDEINMRLNRIEKVTSSKILSLENEKDLENVFTDIIFLDNKNVSIDLFDVLIDSYAKNKKIYLEVLDKSLLKEKKQLIELFQILDNLIKEGNG